MVNRVVAERTWGATCGTFDNHNSPRRPTAAAVLVVVLTGTSLAPAAQDRLGRRLFSVTDSIELSRVVDPNIGQSLGVSAIGSATTPMVSPNGRHMLLVTQRGVLSSNQIESTIWVFNTEEIDQYTLGASAIPPSPRPVVTFAATVNTPVISDVQWLPDSNRIAFLGKDGSPNQRLFVADIIGGTIAGITSDRDYVTAYDIVGRTVAYSTLEDLRDVSKVENTGKAMTTVTARDVSQLLFPESDRLEDLNEWSMVTKASELHIRRDGREVLSKFSFDGAPLQLFRPRFWLSPDEKSLITLAPVREVPPRWERYRSATSDERPFATADRRKYAVAYDNPFKAEQFVVVDLERGVATPLVEAPAGRDLGYAGTCGALWSSDSRSVILSNTLLPLSSQQRSRSEKLNARASAVALIDVVTRETHPIRYIQGRPKGGNNSSYIRALSWDEANNQITIELESAVGETPKVFHETHRFDLGKWTPVLRSSPELRGVRANGNHTNLSIEQDLNRPPVLSAIVNGHATTIWDPNPQLSALGLGVASIFHWKDKSGHPWSGVLVLPPEVDSKKRYPLVIQTHGVALNEFFTDGPNSTGNGGRALASKGIVVLQTDYSLRHLLTPQEGADQIAELESAIERLVNVGLVDRRQVGIVGFSWTCFHVLYALTHRPNLFSTATITDGIDMGYFQYLWSVDGGGGELQRSAEKINGGTPFGNGLANWIRRSPSFNFDRVKAPLLISAFERGAVLYEFGTYAGLRTLRKPVDMVWLRRGNAPHVLIKPSERYISQQGAVDWFDFWLNGHEDPDPSKAEQYTRWRKLREMRNANNAAKGGTQ